MRLRNRLYFDRKRSDLLLCVTWRGIDLGPNGTNQPTDQPTRRTRMAEKYRVTARLCLIRRVPPRGNWPTGSRVPEDDRTRATPDPTAAGRPDPTESVVAGSQRPQNILHALAGIAEKHVAVLQEEQRVLHTGVARRHRPFEHDDVRSLP